MNLIKANERFQPRTRANHALKELNVRAKFGAGYMAVLTAAAAEIWRKLKSML